MENFLEKIKILDNKIKEQLTTVKNANFIVFHDAYQYLEHRYGIKSLGAILINPYVTPGAKKIKELKADIKWKNVKCVFAEPQFPKKLVDLIIESTAAKTAVLDTEWGIGNQPVKTQEAYFVMMENLVANMAKCLS